MGTRDLSYANSRIDAPAFCSGSFRLCHVCLSPGFGNKGLGTSVCSWLGSLGSEDRYRRGHRRHGLSLGHLMQCKCVLTSTLLELRLILCTPNSSPGPILVPRSCCPASYKHGSKFTAAAMTTVQSQSVTFGPQCTAWRLV